MYEASNGETATTGSEQGNVVAFARPMLQRTEPYLTDEERLALRRLIQLLPRLEALERKSNVVFNACPTARRELSDR